MFKRWMSVLLCTVILLSGVSFCIAAKDDALPLLVASDLHYKPMPQKVPNYYHIKLHVDDESVICSYGKQYGYAAYQLDAPDEEWTDKIIARAEEAKKKWEWEQEALKRR